MGCVREVPLDVRYARNLGHEGCTSRSIHWPSLKPFHLITEPRVRILQLRAPVTKSNPFEVHILSSDSRHHLTSYLHQACGEPSTRSSGTEQLMSDIALEFAAHIKAIRAQDEKRASWLNVSTERHDRLRKIRGKLRLIPVARRVMLSSPYWPIATKIFVKTQTENVRPEPRLKCR